MARLGADSPWRLTSRARAPGPSRVKLSTGASEITQASLEEAPDCMESARTVSSGNAGQSARHHHPALGRPGGKDAQGNGLGAEAAIFEHRGKAQGRDF